MAEIGKINVRFTSDTTGFDKGVKRVDSGLDKTQKKTSSFAKSLKGLAPAMGAAFAVTAVVKFGKAMLTAASETEASFKRIETLVGLSREQVQGFEKDVNSLSRETGQSTKQLADALFTVTSAGARGADAMQILERASKASAAGLGETKTIAQAVTAVMQAYGGDTIDAARATDILTATVREGNLEASALAPAIGRVLPLASQLGVGFEEVGASVATFTRLGISSEEAIVGLRGVMSALVNENEAGKESLAAVGTSFAQLRKEVKEKGLQEMLAGLVKKFEGNETALKTVIPEIRGLTAVLGTAGAQGEAYDEILNNITKSSGMLDDAFKGASETTEFKLNKALNNLKTTGEELAVKVLPVVVKFGDAINNLINNLSGFNRTEKIIIATTLTLSNAMAKLPAA